MRGPIPNWYWRRPQEAENRVSSSPFSSKSAAGTEENVLGWSEKSVWTFAFAFCAANALLIQTYFNPDEHWQSLEVAHHIVFGYRHLTWEWKKGIRSYLHPLLFDLLYKVLAVLRLDTPWFMFFCQMTNWFMFFCITRTLSNSLETVLTLMGLFYWLSSSGWHKHFPAASRKLGLFIAATACAVRPTSAITWFYIGFLDLFKMQYPLQFLFLEVVPIGYVIDILSIVVVSELIKKLYYFAKGKEYL